MIEVREQIGPGRFFREERNSMSRYFVGVGQRDVRAELILGRIQKLHHWLIEPEDRGGCLKFICEQCLRSVLGKRPSEQRRRRFKEVVEIVAAEIVDWFENDSSVTADARSRAKRHFGNWARQVVTWNRRKYEPHHKLVEAVFAKLQAEGEVIEVVISPAREISDSVVLTTIPAEEPVVQRTLF